MIRGNSAVLKCSIPSFVADFVSVVSWQDDSGNMYAGTDASSNQGNVSPPPHSACFSLSKVFQLLLLCVGLVRGNWQGEAISGHLNCLVMENCFYHISMPTLVDMVTECMAHA